MKKLLMISAVLAAASGFGGTDPLRTPGFFWMWNDELELPKLEAQLDDMVAHGIRNVCIHPFPNEFRPSSCPSRMKPDYLSDDFLAVVSNVIVRAAALGMHAYLYDEGGWPSGRACGKVAESDAEGRFCRREIDAGGRVNVLDYATRGRDPSLLEPGACERFLELTHERYARYLGGEFGKTVKVAFTDEPNRFCGTAGKSLGWGSDFAERFRERKGYDLVPRVGELIRRTDETDDGLAKLRIDYCEVAAELFAERYLEPLRDWCRAHGLKSGGHFNGEDEVFAYRHYGFGNLLKSLRLLDAPGVDVIWKQLAPQSRARRRELALPFPRYAASAAHQTGADYALSETFGIYGDSLDPFEMKWNVDYQLVRGINSFVFAYYTYSEYGPWMTLFEPHFGPSSPVWDFMPHFSGYVTRCCELLAKGRPGAECAVLFDFRGLWAGGADAEAAAAAHLAIAEALDALQVDYDFFDEDYLGDAEIVDGGIRMGRMTYRQLVVPSAKWLTAATKAKLAEFERRGGIVAGFDSLSKVPRTLQCRGNSRFFRVMKRVDGGRSVYFVVNSGYDPGEAELEFPEGGRIVRFDPATGGEWLVSENGRVPFVYAGGESAVFFAGEVPDCERRPPRIRKGADGLPLPPDLTLGEGWTARRVAEYRVGRERLEHGAVSEAPRPLALGDWREAFGESFSGRVVYRCEFESGSGGAAELDLGKVKWCAGVTLNGEELGKRFFGPFRWDVTLRKGRNVLEVEVANLLVNQTGNEAIRARVNREHPPRSAYDYWQRDFDSANHDSGLIGPVTLRLSWQD